MAGMRSNAGIVNTDGYNYQLYTLLYCVNRLRNNEYVLDYEIGNAVDGYGALNDVVFNATLANGIKITTAIQVKHSNKMIDELYLCQEKRTWLYKYFESFIHIKKTTSLEQLGQLILWTNMPIAHNIRHWFEQFVPDSNENDILGEGSIEGLHYERYKIKSYHRQEIIQKCLDTLRRYSDRDKGSVQRRKDFDSHPGEEWEQFCERFVFYVNVPNVDGLKTFLIKKQGSDFNDVCRLVESCVTKKMTTSDQIHRLFTLVKLRNCMETGPYTKLIFNNLDELQFKVKSFLDEETENVLHIKASQDVDCTVARIIPRVEQVLAPESKRYLVFSYETFNEKWDEVQQIVYDTKLVEMGLKCLIITSINKDEIRNLRSKLSAVKVIFVGRDLENGFDDVFDISSLDDLNKQSIKARKIRLSQFQEATANEILGIELFRKENYEMVLELYKLRKGTAHEITVCEPTLDHHYRSRKTYFTNINGKAWIDIMNNDMNKLIICDQPGMGKTTEMIKHCLDFRKKYQDHLVVYLHCRDAVNLWTGCVENLIYRTIKTNCKLSKYLTEKIVQLSKVILLIDGYDQVSNEFHEKMRFILSEISRFKMFKLYVASRPQYKNEIKDILGECGLCSFEPFSEHDQSAYLRKFLGIEKIKNAEDEKILFNTRCIINQFRSARNVGSPSEIVLQENPYEGGSSDNSPMQTNMIAVIYKDCILSTDLRNSELHTLAFMYKEFVDFKFMDYVKQNFDPTNVGHAQIINDLREIFLHNHALAALKIHHDDQAVTALDCVGDDTETDTRKELLRERMETEQLCERIQFYGLVSTRPTISFINSAYHEYFLALHILAYSMEIRNLEYFMNVFVDKPYGLVYKFMDYILDHINPRENPNRFLYKLVYSDTLPSDYIPPITSRLHPDKMIEFNAALYQWKALKIKYLLSTLIFHKMFNMLELIYDSLRAEIKSQVRLCLDPNCDDHFNRVCFCLKELKTEDTLIEVLKILLKKNSETFVTLYLVCQEEYLLQLLSIPGYFKLFNWFKESQLNEDQRSALTKIISKEST